MTDLPPIATDIPTAPRFQIFPAIGIARVGNSLNYCYVASEIPDLDFVPEGGYRGDPEPDQEPEIPLHPDHSDPTPGPDDIPTFLGPRRLKRMGCRFRIFEFQSDPTHPLGAVPLREITLDDPDVEIEWHVELVNRKAGAAADWGMGLAPDRALNGNHDPEDPTIPAQYIIEARNGIAGRDQGPATLVGQIMRGLPQQRDVKLGDLTTDDVGRLVLYGGHGVAESWQDPGPEPDKIRNATWYDDTSDGIVTATVTIDGETYEALAARIVVGPPDYAHPCIAPVSLFDLALDRAIGEEPETSFTDHIHPLLHRASFLEWTLFKIVGPNWGRTPKHGHGFTSNHDMHPDGAFLDPRVFPTIYEDSAEGDRRRQMYLDYLKLPDWPNTPFDQRENQSMPAIEGLTFTSIQYEHFRRLNAKDFINDWDETRDPRVLHPPRTLIPIGDLPKTLNRAAMDFAVGGPFFPGIEVGAIMADPATYVTVGNADGAINFRVAEDVPAGALTATLAVPWQAGFNQHNYRDDEDRTADNLWPSARPVAVSATAHGTSDDVTWTRPFSATRTDDKFERQKMRTNRQMIDNWWKLGFIAPKTTYIETERILPEDPKYPV